MEEVLGIFGEVDHSDLLHKAQTIKGNRLGQAGSLVPYQCGEAVADGSDQMPQPQMQAAHFGR